ncbi:MAG: membrane protein insertion efficiency factor YidD [Candidatus Nealsonbacteria bacterium RBG_13_36_15]|uniref:Putative membrane protein insertion efficiency factor n=1 Tax=Candidatus Nealsonbacteria bacterium RBG_13_36_15 TaxID=1801660 RepID=A0A1G2DW69_9BACT|nr:MAG: membrane protein insertion efficiency factor YidD [Candidatus Nealsonbacteria bacterium RBG_13_36_15]
MEKVVSKIIKLYQNFISPHLGQNCRFWPSCSEYTNQAIKKYGLKKGLFLFTRRLLKCHPWHQGGIDLP